MPNEAWVTGCKNNHVEGMSGYKFHANATKSGCPAHSDGQFCVIHLTAFPPISCIRNATIQNYCNCLLMSPCSPIIRGHSSPPATASPGWCGVQAPGGRWL